MAKKEKLRLATITVLVKGRRENSSGVNRILTNNGRFVMARLGVNVQRHCVSGCTAMIVVAVEASAKDISRMTKELNKLRGIAAKACVFT